MPNISFRAALPLLFAAMSMTAASANTSNNEAEASVAILPRTYMGQTVEVPESRADFNPEKPSWWSGVRATGSIQTEFMAPMNDESLGIKAKDYSSPVLNNTYFDLTVNAPYVSAGARFQFTKWPLPGFEDKIMPGFAGWGVPYFWITGKYKWAQITAGDFYEQFGSGLILRTYQERALGVDGALRGARVKLNPGKGFYFTALTGHERRFWKHTPDLIWGADAEWSLNESFSSAFNPQYGITLGFSYVGKHDRRGNGDNVTTIIGDDQYRLNFPQTIAAFDGRVSARLKDFSILAEYATKNNDPNAVNNYIYRRGQVELLSVSYAAKGFSAYVQAKRSENMAFMSDQEEQTNAFINYLPAFTNTQTYTLAALYPYATDYNGEWAYQAEVRYLFKRNTPLGGKYGTNVKLSGSYITDLENQAPLGPKVTDASGSILDKDPAQIGTDGYGSAFWKMGGLRYADINFEISKKFSRKIQLTLFYLFQRLNYDKIFGHPTEHAGDIMVNANTFILEGQWKMAKRAQLRWEIQYLTTRQDDKDWVCGLAELSLAPHWMFTLSDNYNCGVTKEHYYTAMVTFNYRANRFGLSFARNRAGFNCSGGVCRWVPASKGFSLSYNYTF